MKQPERGKTVAARYTLEKPIGKGAMGDVWVVRHQHNGRRFAMKLLKGSALDSAELRARLQREARLVATLATPHIAQVTDSGLDDEGDPYVVLELLEGEDLHRRLRREERLSLPAVVGIAAQVGKALRTAHGAGLVHRDLKPANIFLARQDGEEIVKVLDFGIAKSLGAETTEYTATGAMLGTAPYMSPEHVRDAKHVDHRADLWAFAVVLFRALTGEMPFPQTGLDLFVAMGRDPIPAPTKVTSAVPGLPAPLDVFFERAFAQDIERRYPSAAALVEGFCRAAGVPVPANEASGITPAHLLAQSALPVSRPVSPATVPLPGALPPAAAPIAATIADPMSRAAPVATTVPDPTSGSGAAPVAATLSGPASAPASSGDARGKPRHTLGGTLKLDDSPATPTGSSPPATPVPPAPRPPRRLAATVPDPQELKAAAAAATAPTVVTAPSRRPLWIGLAVIATAAILAAALLFGR